MKWTVAKSSGIILFAIDWDLRLEGWSVDFLPFRRLAIFFLSLCCLSSLLLDFRQPMVTKSLVGMIVVDANEYYEILVIPSMYLLL